MSLLISREAPRQADLSMSPFLKQTVPQGTLGFDNTQASKPTKAQDDAAKNATIGWNFQSLNSAADRLLHSATKLEDEMKKEARYWEGILSVSEKGWAVCRLPREGHAVGVRFGFSEGMAFSRKGGASARLTQSSQLRRCLVLRGLPLYDQTTTETSSSIKGSPPNLAPYVLR